MNIPQEHQNNKKIKTNKSYIHYLNCRCILRHNNLMFWAIFDLAKIHIIVMSRDVLKLQDWLLMRLYYNEMLDFNSLLCTSAVRMPISSRAIKRMYIWVWSQNCGFLVTWFCYQLIAKPGNKTATCPWPDPSVSCGTKTTWHPIIRCFIA